MIKICLYCARYNFERMTEEPLGIGYIIAYLLQQRIISETEIRIVDDLSEALAYKPDIIGISSVSQVINNARNFAKKCKEEFDCLTVLGGYHVTCIPQKLPDEFDIGVLGEGEETFAEIVNCFKINKLTVESFSYIKGICFRKNEEIVINKTRKLIGNIDLIPLPYRHKIYNNGMSIFTSRGCPYQCTFCASHKFWAGKFRMRSAHSVIAEISHIVNKYHPQRISIMDDLWLFDKKRLEEIGNMVIKSGISKKVSFTGFCRSNIIWEEDVRLLKKMNFRYIRFGAESGSEVLLKRLKGNNISIEDHQRVIDLCQRYKMPCFGSFMFGVPGETKDDLQATIKFLRKNKKKFKIGGFYLFNPIPGTEIWDMMKDKKMVSDDFPFEYLQIDFMRKNFSWDNILYFNQSHVSLQEFREYIDKIRKEFIDVTFIKKLLLYPLLKTCFRKIKSFGEK